MISLKKEEIVAVSGILVNSPWEEPVAKFLESVGLQAERVAELDAKTEVKRMGTRVDVFALEKRERLPEKPLNRVQISGLVINAWTYSGNNFARLAIYDRHTEIIKYKQPFPKREAHYVTVQTKNKLRKKGKVRGQGEVVIRLYRESVSEVVQKLRLDLGLSEKELEAYAIKPSVFADLKTVVVFG